MIDKRLVKIGMGTLPTTHKALADQFGHGLFFVRLPPITRRIRKNLHAVDTAAYAYCKYGILFMLKNE